METPTKNKEAPPRTGRTITKLADIAAELGVSDQVLRAAIRRNPSGPAALAVRQSSTGRWHALSDDVAWLKAQDWR